MPSGLIVFLNSWSEQDPSQSSGRPLWESTTRRTADYDLYHPRRNSTPVVRGRVSVKCEMLDFLQKEPALEVEHFVDLLWDTKDSLLFSHGAHLVLRENILIDSDDLLSAFARGSVRHVPWIRENDWRLRMCMRADGGRVYWSEIIGEHSILKWLRRHETNDGRKFVEDHHKNFYDAFNSHVMPVVTARVYHDKLSFDFSGWSSVRDTAAIATCTYQVDQNAEADKLSELERRFGPVTPSPRRVDMKLAHDERGIYRSRARLGDPAEMHKFFIPRDQELFSRLELFRLSDATKDFFERQEEDNFESDPDASDTDN